MTRVTTPALLAALSACGAPSTPVSTGSDAQADTAEPSIAATEATMILVTPAEGSDDALRELVQGAGSVVADSEPDTLLWYGLEDDSRRFGIFDLFTDEAARQTHFEGQVAAALQSQSNALVEGGWEQGVLANVRNYDVLVTTAVRDSSPNLATYIQFRAQEGRADELAELLTGAGELVWQTEPGTLFWTALRDENDPRRFAIYDTFVDGAGRDAHFGGQVAGALQAAAADLVEGGWDGVVAGVHHFEVRSTN